MILAWQYPKDSVIAAGEKDFRTLARQMHALSLLMIYCVSLMFFIYRFCTNGCPARAGSGRYFAITWQISRSKTYRSMVYTLAFVPLGRIISDTFMLRMYASDLKLDDLNTYASCVSAYFVLMMSLSRLLFPVNIHMDWDTEDFKNLYFHRNLKNMFRNNQDFCIQLTHALFQAKCGERTELLEKMLHSGDAVQQVLRVCCDAEKNAAAQKEAHDRLYQIIA
jgi:hypothetical protein